MKNLEIGTILSTEELEEYEGSTTLVSITTRFADGTETGQDIHVAGTLSEYVEFLYYAGIVDEYEAEDGESFYSIQQDEKGEFLEIVEFSDETDEYSVPDFLNEYEDFETEEYFSPMNPEEVRRTFFPKFEEAQDVKTVVIEIAEDITTEEDETVQYRYTTFETVSSEEEIISLLKKTGIQENRDKLTRPGSYYIGPEALRELGKNNIPGLLKSRFRIVLSPGTEIPSEFSALFYQES